MAMTSIRRKLNVGLGLITVMLLLLLGGGSVLLYSYGQLIDDLEHSLYDVPQREKLLNAAHELQRSLDDLSHVVDKIPTAKTASPPVPSPEPEHKFAVTPRHQELLRHHGRDVLQAYSELQAELKDFRTRMDGLADGRKGELNTLVMFLMGGIEHRTYALSAKIQYFNDPVQLLGVLPETRKEVGLLLEAVWDLPKPEGNLGVPLDKANQFYKHGYQTLWWTCGIVVFILGSIFWYAYRWLFRPVRILHDGTSRVAQGDFDYRIRLDQHDEMGELADAFNKMTVRFQEIKQDLDRQVRERVKQLIRSERLAGIGFLATGVAHEINTPLTGILGAAQALISRKDEYLTNLTQAEREDLLDYLDIMEDASKQCRAITDRLLQYARGEETRSDSSAIRNPVDLARIVRDVLHMVSHMSRFRDHKLKFDFKGEVYIQANGTEIKQVILNLVANGLEAMPDGGTLTAELIESTDQVELRIRDEGIGMTPEVIENLFEPFFTQNKPGKGTGLGMAITHRIVSDHGGTIEPQSDGPGTGSTFLLHLPKRIGVTRAA